MAQGSLGTLVKDPADIRTYSIDWSAWLTDQNNDTISSVTWTLDTGLTSVAESNTSTVANIKISGGSNGRQYDVACTVVTVAGQTKKVSFFLQVEYQ